MKPRSPLFIFVLSVAITALLIPVLPAYSQGPQGQQVQQAPQGPNGDGPRTKRPAAENGEERRGPRPGGGFRGGDRQRLEGFKPDYDRYLNNLKERNPEEAKRLAALKESDEGAFKQAMRNHFMGGKGMFRKPNPKLDAIRGRLRAALEAHHANPSDDTKAALRKVIEEEFDEGCADHQRHIDQMEEVLTKMKSAVADQRSRRSEHIENRVKRAMELRLIGPGPRKGKGTEGPRKK